MGGLVAGTGIREYKAMSASLKMVAMTVNNDCNLSCPHCYLQYDASSALIPKDIVKKMLEQEFDDLVLVGREPFLNRETIDYSSTIARDAAKAGKKVSAITNGTNLHLVSPKQLKEFRFIDISFDGGPMSYKKARSASYEKVRRNACRVVECGVDIRGINVLYRENIPFIDDMMKLMDEIPLSMLMFSPYMPSENHGANTAGAVPLDEMLAALKQNKRFMNESSAFLLLDAYHLKSEGLNDSTTKRLINEHRLMEKVHLVPHTPLKIGTIRVTFDGLILSPEAAIHPVFYKESGRIARSGIFNPPIKLF